MDALISSGALKVAIHRLRQKFGEAIRSEIADTVDTEEEIAGELRYLIEVLQVRYRPAQVDLFSHFILVLFLYLIFNCGPP